MAPDKVGRRLLSALAGSTPAFTQTSNRPVHTRGRRFLSALAGSTVAFTSNQTINQYNRQPTNQPFKLKDEDSRGISFSARLQAAREAVASPAQDSDLRLGAWKRPALIGGIVVVGLCALAVWQLSPNNPESSATERPSVYLADVAVASPPANVATQGPATLGGKLYTKSYILSVPCMDRMFELDTLTHIDQYHEFIAVVGVPDDTYLDRTVRYDVEVDGVVRASGQASSSSGPTTVRIPLSSAKTINIRASTLNSTPPTSCSDSLLGIGNPGFS